VRSFGVELGAESVEALAARDSWDCFVTYDFAASLMRGVMRRQ
jgi:hypothetical protein